MIVERDGVEYGYASDIGERLASHGIANAHGLIRKWKSLGLLTPVGHAGNRPIYLVSEVLKVELQQRKAAATRRGGRRRLTIEVEQFTIVRR